LLLPGIGFYVLWFVWLWFEKGLEEDMASFAGLAVGVGEDLEEGLLVAGVGALESIEV
jgi:hypothetical protein